MQPNCTRPLPVRFSSRPDESPSPSEISVAKESKSPKSDVKRVLIVDDHPLVRERLAQLINAHADLKVCGEADDREPALAMIATTEPHLVLLDLSLKSSHGLEFIKDISAQRPGVLILVVSMHDESLFAERSFRAGAHGYITKQEATRNIIVAIRRVLAGELYISESMSHKVLQRILPGQSAATIPAIETLSDRELEVLRLLGRGQTTGEIAASLHVEPSTIETYRGRIKRKLHIPDGSELLKYAINWVRANDQS